MEQQALTETLIVTRVPLADLQDGQRLASGSSDNTVKIWDTDTGRTVRTLEGHGGSVPPVLAPLTSAHLVHVRVDRESGTVACRKRVGGDLEGQAAAAGERVASLASNSPRPQLRRNRACDV